MIKSPGKLGAAAFMVWAGVGFSAAASAQSIVFKDVEVSRPIYDSVLVVGSDSRARTGMEVRELQRTMDQVRDQTRTLDDLKNQNRALQRKVPHWSENKATATVVAVAVAAATARTSGSSARCSARSISLAATWIVYVAR